MCLVNETDATPVFTLNATFRKKKEVAEFPYFNETFISSGWLIFQKTEHLK